MSRIAVASVVAGSLIVLGGAARADAVMDWNNLAAVVSETDGMAHPESATKWSPKEDAEEIVAVAIFQAVNTIHPLYTPAREALAPWFDSYPTLKSGGAAMRGVGASILALQGRSLRGPFVMHAANNMIVCITSALDF